MYERCCWSNSHQPRSLPFAQAIAINRSSACICSRNSLMSFCVNGSLEVGARYFSTVRLSDSTKQSFRTPKFGESFVQRSKIVVISPSEAAKRSSIWELDEDIFCTPLYTIRREVARPPLTS